MAFGQTNTGFQIGASGSPFSTGFSSGFSTGSSVNTRTTTTKKKDDYTYNSRYPGFDENDYKRLVELVSAQGVTGSKFDQLMDEAYQYYYPQVLNKHKLAERGEELNQSVYQNGDAILNGEGDANEKIKLTQLSQKAKEKFGIPYDFPDEELLKMMEEGTENWNNLLYDYVYKGSDELLYQTGIYDTKQGGIKSLINPASDGGILPEGGWNVANPIGYATELTDNAANKFADRWLDRGNMLAENSTENLKNEIDNMSQEEVRALREQYNKLVDAVDQDDNYSIGEIALDTWKLLGYGTAGLYDKLVTAGQGNLGDVAFSKAQDIANKMITSYKKEDGGYGVDKKKAKSDEAFLDWLISQKANLGQSLVGADDILRGETNPNVVQFFANIPSSALKTFTATVRGMTNPLDTFKGLYKLAFTPEGHEAILQRYGSWDALANAMNTDPVGVADDILAVAELGTNIVGGGLKFTGKVTGNSNLVNMGTNLKGSIGSANDVLAQRTVGGIYGGLDNLAGMTDNKLVQMTNRYIQDTSSLQKLSDNIKSDLKAVENSSFGQSMKDAYDEAVNKMVGIDEADREFIRENKDLVNETLSKKKNVETIYEDVKGKLDDKILEKIETGEEYEKLYKSNKKVVNTQGLTSDKKLISKLKAAGVTVDADGNLVFNKINDFDATQQKALQDAWETLKTVEGEKKLNARQTLGQRRKIDNKINREGKPDKMTATDLEVEQLIKDMRKPLDAKAKEYIPGLKELDAKYQPMIEEVRQIKKDWFNPDGTIKDNARSKLRNLTKAGNEERLARLEQLMPGITKDLKALDVSLTVEKASKQGVGQYSKGIMGGSIPAAIVNPAAGVAGAVLWVLSSPKVYVRLIEAYPDIAQKIAAGQELLPSDMNKLTSWASRIQDGMDMEE